MPKKPADRWSPFELRKPLADLFRDYPLMAAEYERLLGYALHTEAHKRLEATVQACRERSDCNRVSHPRRLYITTYGLRLDLAVVDLSAAELWRIKVALDSEQITEDVERGCTLCQLVEHALVWIWEGAAVKHWLVRSSELVALLVGLSDVNYVDSKPFIFW
jgi:hypothetical protein